jgi:predicted TIM-barrel fold metal-dependent hydrolase
VTTSRREFLAGAVSAAALTSLRAAQKPADFVDVHAHFTPPQYVRDLANTNLLFPASRDWSIARHLEEMEKAGVGRSLLSLTTPGVSMGDAEQARRMSRYSNEYGAQLVADHSRQLGLFVTLPLPDIEGSLREIEYGLDTLRSSGVCLFTSYTGKYLGDEAFTPVLEELNRRKAIVYVHPTSAACCTNLLPRIPDPVIEYGTDTTRAITNMIYSGASSRYTGLRMIFSHAGGTMPFLIERFDFGDRSNPRVKQQVPEGFRAAAARFFYDVAQASNPTALGALRQVVPVKQIVFGTDYPFRTMQEHVEKLEAARVFSAAELQGVRRDNIARSLTRLLG